METKLRKNERLIIGGHFRVSNTGGNARFAQRSAVRVYDERCKGDPDKGLVAEFFVSTRNPLSYLRTWPQGKLATRFRRQLEEVGVPEEVIDEIILG